MMQLETPWQGINKKQSNVYLGVVHASGLTMQLCKLRDGTNIAKSVMCAIHMPRLTSLYSSTRVWLQGALFVGHVMASPHRDDNRTCLSSTFHPS